MIRWDNGPIPKGETRSHLVGLNDLFATLCELAGIDVPEEGHSAIDSVSFADYIANEDSTDDLREFLGVWAVKDGIIRQESIRKNNLKLVRDRESGDLFLYDLDTDLSETTNLVHRNSYRVTVSEMMNRLKEIGPCYDSENTFHVVGNGGVKQQRTCAWFREQPNRCNMHSEGAIECRSTCPGRNAIASVQILRCLVLKG